MRANKGPTAHAFYPPIGCFSFLYGQLHLQQCQVFTRKQHPLITKGIIVVLSMEYSFESGFGESKRN